MAWLAVAGPADEVGLVADREQPGCSRQVLQHRRQHVTVVEAPIELDREPDGAPGILSVERLDDPRRGLRGAPGR